MSLPTQIRTLTLRDYRGIEELSLDFTDRTLTVLIGENGAGKSSILDCLGRLLAKLGRDLHGKNDPPTILEESDISNGKEAADVTFVMQFDGDLIEHEIQRRHDGETGGGTDGLAQMLDRAVAAARKEQPPSGRPIAVHYSVQRAVTDVIQIDVDDEPTTIADLWRDVYRAGSGYRSFFSWFRQREDIENEERAQDTEVRDAQLAAVRRAVESFLPGFSDLRVRRRPRPHLVVRKGDEELSVDQLSDGEKGFLALVGDIAHRLAHANAAAPDPLAGEGIVLIDEIELHLHPAWQRNIVPKLVSTFPRCQFIVTTHSPQVLGDVAADAVICLRREGRTVRAYRPDPASGPWGRESSDILEALMGAPARPEAVRRDLDTLFKLIDQGNIAEAKARRSDLEARLGPGESELLRADGLIRRREVLGR